MAPSECEGCSTSSSSRNPEETGSEPQHASHELRDHNIERSDREEPGAPKKPRACLGVLYFNQRRYDARKSPLCGGLRKKLHESDGIVQLPTDSVPGGDFKYICLGYSAFDEEGLKRAAARRNSETDGITLPYCEGLEIISAAALNRKPDLMSVGGPDVNPPAAPEGPSHSDDRQQRPGRRFVPGAPEIPERMTFDKFRERFERMAGRMVDKMQSNAVFMVSHIKRTWQQVARELGGGGRGDRDR